MTLREKFDKIEVNIEEGLSGIIYLNDIEAEECEQVAEEFAIGFAEWMTSGVEFIDDTEIGRIYEYKHKKYTTKELLEIYKKENKL